MRYRFALVFSLLFFFYHHLCAKNEASADSIFGGLQGHIDMVSPYSVNVAGGDFIDHEVDLDVPSPEPITISRSYDSQYSGNADVYGKWFARPECIMHVDALFDSGGKVDKGVFYVPETSGAVVEYKLRKEKSGSVRPECYRHFCNNASGILSGQTNLKNQALFPVGKAFCLPGTYVLIQGDGGERTYRRNEKNGEYFLSTIKKPNGNYFIYHYTGGGILAKLETQNSVGQSLCSVSFNYFRKESGFEALGSNGQKAVYMNIGSSAKYDKNKKYLSKVERSQKPTVDYTYLFPCADVSGVIREVNGKLRVVQYPDGRIVQNEYYTAEDFKGRDNRIGKVKEQKAPLGERGQLVTVARYEYDHPKKEIKTTVVYDAYNVKKVYKLCRENRIHSIAHYDSTNALAYIEKMVWGEQNSPFETFLLTRKIENPQGETLLAKRWIYDERGNVLEEQTIGDLTGSGCKTVHIDEKGLPVADSSDCFSIKHHYSNDGFNLLLETIDGASVRTEYKYKPKTNLPIAKYTYSPAQIIVKREFFEYDVNGQMITRISDDGWGLDASQLDKVTERHIERMSYNSYGKASQIIESYFDTQAGIERQLYRKEMVYNESALPVKEILYDADNAFYAEVLSEYDDRGRLKEKIDALGRSTRFTYDVNNNVLSTQGPEPSVCVYFTYDLNNRLTCQVQAHADGVELATTYRYDLNGKCVSQTDPWGATIQYEYDFAGRNVKTIMPPILSEDGMWNRPETKQEYSLLGYATRAQDPKGYETHVTYTISGLPIEIRFSDGSEKHYVYTLDGKIASLTTPNGETILYEYDYFGRETSATRYADSKEFQGKSTLEYDAFHLRSKTDEEGRTTRLEYDSAGRLIREIKGKEVKEYGYDSIGRLNRTVYRDGALWVAETTKQDVLNRLIEERAEDSLGNILSLKRYDYDLAGNKTTTTIFLQEGKQATTFVDYDALCQPIRKIDALGHCTTIFYDEIQIAGSRYRRQTETDPLGKRTVTIFNLHGQVEEVKTLSAEGKTLALQKKFYDPNGSLSLYEEEIYNQGSYLRTYRVKWDYGPGGRVESETIAADSPEEKTTRFHYDDHGKLRWKHKPDGTTIFHEYDPKGRLCRQYSPGQGNIAPIDYILAYDKVDNLTHVYDRIQGVDILRSYNEEGHIAKEEQKDHYVHEYTYDAMGRKTGTRLLDGSEIRYRYGSFYLLAIERLNSRAELCGTHLFESRTMTGKPLKMQTRAGSFIFEYDLLERITRIDAPHYLEENLQYDSCSNLLNFTFHDALGSQSCRYLYDELYQLVLEEGAFTHSFLFDSLHNRLANDGRSCQVNQLNQSLQQNEFHYLYDNCGNLIQKNSESKKISCKYDALDRLIEITEEGNVRLQFAYDYFHRRISKRVLVYEDQHWKTLEHLYFLYDGQKEIGAVDDQGTIVELRILSPLQGGEMGSAVAHELYGKVYIPVHDHRGCVVALIQQEGTVAEFYRYSAFGEEKIGVVEKFGSH